MIDELTPPADPGLADAESGDTGHVVEVIENVSATWDTLVTNFSDICFEQTAAYAVSRWGNSRLCGLVLRGAMSGEPEAAALAVMAALPMLKAGLAYIKFGPLWRRCDRPARPQVLASVLAALKQEFARTRGLLVRVMPPADPDFSKQWADELSASGFRRTQVVEGGERYLIDLRLREDEQLASLGAKWRANLRKVSPGLEIREMNPQQALPDFMRLYGAMSERKKFVDHHHVKQLPAFVMSAPPELGVRLFMAHVADRPVAGSILVGTGDCVAMPFSASTTEALPLRAGYALRWAIINRLRDSNACWLDLGGDEGDPGLRHFKAGNVGTRGRVVVIPGEFDYAGSALSSAATRALGWARTLSRIRPLQRIASSL